MCSILYFCGYIWTSVSSMSLLYRITFLTYTVVWHSLFLWLRLGICHFNVFAVENYIFNLYSLFLWLHLGVCHFNVFAVENYIFNLYSCAAFFISVVTSVHLCHFNVFAVENYIFNLYSCVAFFIFVVTSGHLSFQCLCCRELHF